MQIRSEQDQKTGRLGLWVKDQEDSVEFSAPLHPIDEEGMEEHSALADCIDKLKAEQKECVRIVLFSEVELPADS